MTIPTSRENSTRRLSTADLAAASRQSPRVSTDPNEIEKADREERARDPDAGELKREEPTALRRGVPNTDLHRGNAATAADSQDTDELSRDEDIGTPDNVRRTGEIESLHDDQERSGSFRPGNLSREDSSPSGAADDRSQESLEALFAAEQAEGYRDRWIEIQSSFVDDPSAAVRAGDELVAEVMSALANSFAGQRHRMESQLGNSGSANTEDLRVALRSYRSFFERLLSL
jgi:hypothetical protein